MTNSFENPLQNAHTKELILSFDTEANDPVNQTLKNGQVWSGDMARLCSLFWDENSNIVDIGTHIGTFSSLAASFTKGKVIAIEPEPNNFSYLLKNKENNNFEHLECHNVAASDKEGEVKFCCGGPGSHIYSPGWSEETISVPAKPLDSLLKDVKVDFIKMDVEGWELPVLDGLKETIERDSPPIVFEVNGFTLQWFDKTPNDLIKRFEQLGYRIFVMFNKFIPINSWEPFPFNVVDCFALKDYHIPKIAQFLTLPLSETDRKNILTQSEYYSNEDMKKYFAWYKLKFSL